MEFLKPSRKLDSGSWSNNKYNTNNQETEDEEWQVDQILGNLGGMDEQHFA